MKYQLPRKYRKTIAGQSRYLEGWKDATLGRKQAYVDGRDDFIRHNGKSQLAAYEEGYQAGQAAVNGTK
jgi:hypothetical protein